MTLQAPWARPEAKRVVLLNAWHDDNKGDAAITEGILGLLLEHMSDVEITVVGLTEEADPASRAMRHLARFYPEICLLPSPTPSELRGRTGGVPRVDIPIWWLRLLPSICATTFGSRDRRYESLFADADLVIGVGGSNIYTDESVHALVSLTRLFTVIAPLRASIVRDVPTILLGHTLGPFPESRPATLRIAQQMLSGVQRTVVREEKSLEVAARLGLGEVALAPDMAYGIEPRKTDAVVEAIAALPASIGRTAIVAMRSHPSLGSDADARVVGEIVTALGELIERDKIDHVLVVAHTLGPTAIEDDRAVSARLAEAVNERGYGATYFDVDLSPGELAALYGAAACMIAVRLHAAILAMLSGTPTFAIAYFSSKSVGVMRQAGQEDCTAEFSDVDAEHILDALGPRIGDESFRRTLADTSRRNRQTLIVAAEAWFNNTETNTARLPERRS